MWDALPEVGLPASHVQQQSPHLKTLNPGQEALDRAQNFVGSLAEHIDMLTLENRCLLDHERILRELLQMQETHIAALHNNQVADSRFAVFSTDFDLHGQHENVHPSASLHTSLLITCLAHQVQLRVLAASASQCPGEADALCHLGWCQSC